MSYDTVVAADSPTHWWKQGDAIGASAAADTAGATAAAVTGTVSFGQSGIPGSAATAALIAVGASEAQGGAVYASPTGGVTIEVLFKTTAAGSAPGGFGQSTAPIVTFANTSPGNYGYQIGLDGTGHIRAYSYPGSLTSPAAVNDGGWHHAVLEIDGSGNGKLYVDNSLVVSGSLGHESFNGNWYIGGAISGSGFSGTVAHVAVYEGVQLTATQIGNHYSATGITPTPPPVTVTALTASLWSSSAGPVTTPVVAPSGAGRVILVVDSESNSSVPANVSSVTGLGVTWTRRSKNQYPAGSGQSTEVWWADVPSGTSGAVTFTLDRSIDDGTFHVLFAQKSDGTAPFWDTNASLPQLLTGATGGTAPVSSDGIAPYVLIFAGNGANSHNSGPTPVSASLSSVSNGAAVRYEYSDVWGGGLTGPMSATTAGVTAIQSGGTVTVDALDATLNWNGTAPPLTGFAAAQVPAAPPFIEFTATGTAQMLGARFPLVGPDSPLSFTAKLAALPPPPVVTVAAPTRVWHPPRTYQRFATVKLAVLPPPPVKKLSAPTRVWSNVAIFTHVTPRPSFGQLWPRGTAAGPPA